MKSLCKGRYMFGLFLSAFFLLQSAVVFGASVSEENVSIEMEPAAVKAAAEETAKVAEETTEVVEETTKVAEKTTEVVEEATKVVEKTTEVVEETAKAAEETTEVVEETAKVAEETAEVVKETSKVAEEETKTNEEAIEVEGVAQEVEEISGDDSSTANPFYDKYVAGKLQLGTRSVYRHFVNSDSGHRGGTFGSGTYLGTIYAMEEKQNFAPLHPYIIWYFLDNVGIEVAYDHLEAETVATSIYSKSDKTDGNVVLSGPTLSLLARYQNETKFTPWIGLGMFFYSASFDADPVWAHSKRYTDAYNEMTVEDVQGLFFSLGADWEIDQHWLVNLSCQYMSVDVDAVYNGYLHGLQYTRQPGYFPVDNFSFRIGIGYQF